MLKKMSLLVFLPVLCPGVFILFGGFLFPSWELQIISHSGVCLIKEEANQASLRGSPFIHPGFSPTFIARNEEQKSVWGLTVGAGVGGGLHRGGQRGKNWDNCNRINNNKRRKDC